MTTTKPMEVQIMNANYVLGCPEGEEGELLDAVKRVDEAMCKIRDTGKTKARERVAVLAALNIALELHAQIKTLQKRAERPAAPSVVREDVSSEWSSEKIKALIQRLDHSLSGDGRLF